MSFEKMTLNQRIQAANIDCMRHPKFALLAGVIMMGKSEVTDKLPTAATNGKDKLYGSAFIQDMTRKQLRYVVLHENFHVALKHCVLYKDIKKKWAKGGSGFYGFVNPGADKTKAQQDALLPHVEEGLIVLVGATTENPSFEVNSALLSRSKVYVLEALTADDLVTLLARALSDPERGLGRLGCDADDDALRAIAVYANGDARVAVLKAVVTQASSAIPVPPLPLLSSSRTPLCESMSDCTWS